MRPAIIGSLVKHVKVTLAILILQIINAKFVANPYQIVKPVLLSIIAWLAQIKHTLSLLFWGIKI